MACGSETSRAAGGREGGRYAVVRREPECLFRFFCVEGNTSSRTSDHNNGGCNKNSSIASTSKGPRPLELTATAEHGEGRTSRRYDVLLLLVCLAVAAAVVVCCWWWWC
jgi:hypothetical protein